MVPLPTEGMCLGMLVHHVAMKFKQHPSSFMLHWDDAFPIDSEQAFGRLLAASGGAGAPIRVRMEPIHAPPPFPPHMMGQQHVFQQQHQHQHPPPFSPTSQHDRSPHPGLMPNPGTMSSSGMMPRHGMMSPPGTMPHPGMHAGIMHPGMHPGIMHPGMQPPQPTPPSPLGSFERPVEQLLPQQDTDDGGEDGDGEGDDDDDDDDDDEARAPLPTAAVDHRASKRDDASAEAPRPVGELPMSEATSDAGGPSLGVVPTILDLMDEPDLREVEEGEEEDDDDDDDDDDAHPSIARWSCGGEPPLTLPLAPRVDGAGGDDCAEKDEDVGGGAVRSGASPIAEGALAANRALVAAASALTRAEADKQLRAVAAEQAEQAEQAALKRAIAQAREARRAAEERVRLEARAAAEAQQHAAAEAQQHAAANAKAEAARQREAAEKVEAAKAAERARAADKAKRRAEAAISVGRWVRRLQASGLAEALVASLPPVVLLRPDDLGAAAAAAASAGASPESAAVSATAGGAARGATAGSAVRGAVGRQSSADAVLSAALSAADAAADAAALAAGEGLGPGGFVGESLDFRVDRGLVDALRGLLAHPTPPPRRHGSGDGGGGGSDDEGGGGARPSVESSADLLRAFDRGDAIGVGSGGLSRDALATFFANLAAPRPLEPYPLADAYPRDGGGGGGGGGNSSGGSSSVGGGAVSPYSSRGGAPDCPKPVAALLDALAAKMIRFRCTAVSCELFARALVVALWELAALDRSLLDFDAWWTGDDDDDAGDVDDLDLAFYTAGGSGGGSGGKSKDSGGGSGGGGGGGDGSGGRVTGASFVGLSVVGRARAMGAMSLRAMTLEEALVAVEDLCVAEEDARAVGSALAAAHGETEELPDPALECGGSEAVEVLKLLGGDRRDAYCASRCLPLLLGPAPPRARRAAAAAATSSSAASTSAALVARPVAGGRLGPFLEFAGLGRLHGPLRRVVSQCPHAAAHQTPPAAAAAAGDIAVDALRFLLG